MPLNSDDIEMRLRILLTGDQIPQWVGEFLLALDQFAGVELQLQRLSLPDNAPVLSALSRYWRQRIPALAPWRPDSATNERLQQWEARATGTCEIVLYLDEAARSSAAHTEQAIQWTIVDGDGHSLNRHFPLMETICAGAGLPLALLEQSPLSKSSQPIRQIHLASTPRYEQALRTLPHALSLLIRQALSKHRPGILTPLPPHSQAAFNLAGASALARLSGPAWWQGLQGFAKAGWRRLQARLLSEYWCIGVIDSPISNLLDDRSPPEVRWLICGNAAGYWADPFGSPGIPGRLVCEFFDEHTGVGHLEVLQIGAHQTVTERIALTVGNGQHVSFPNVFEVEGRRLGIAETTRERQCWLYEVDVKGDWQPIANLLDDVSAADPAIFSWEGNFWLAFTNTDIGEHDNLCLYHANRLEGPWKPHANNPVKVDVAGSRMAGGLFWHQGNLYRPAQDCLQTYGAAVVIHRIIRLTPEEFEEIPVRRLDPVPGICRDGLHTLNAWGEKTLIDGKRHAFNHIALWRTLRRRLDQYIGLPSTRTRPVVSGKNNRLMLYVPKLRVGGAEISMLRLAEGLAANGLNVDLVVHSHSSADLAIPPGVTLHSLDCNSTASALWGLVLLLRKLRPQWTLSAFPHTNIAVITALALSGVDSRCVITEHAPLSRQIAQQDNWRYRLLPALVRWAYRRAHAIVAVSDGVRDDLLSLLGPGTTPLVINNPVLAGNYEAEMARTPDDSWLASDDLQVILSVCRLSVEKDLPTLVHAFAEIHRKHPTTRLILAGEGPDRQRLAALIDKLGLAEVVRLPGYTPNPLPWMRHAAVFVLSSQYEGFGNVLVEAMACGTPVVSTDCPVGPSEILEGGRFGDLVPVGNAPAMAAAISRALLAGDQAVGAHAAALRYTQANACANYLQLFERLNESRIGC